MSPVLTAPQRCRRRQAGTASTPANEQLAIAQELRLNPEVAVVAQLAGERVIAATK